MKVQMITGEMLETNESFGARLIEQGKAVLPPAEKKAPKAEKKPAKEAAEKAGE